MQRRREAPRLHGTFQLELKARTYKMECGIQPASYESCNQTTKQTKRPIVEWLGLLFWMARPIVLLYFRSFHACHANSEQLNYYCFSAKARQRSAALNSGSMEMASMLSIDIVCPPPMLLLLQHVKRLMLWASFQFSSHGSDAKMSGVILCADNSHYQTESLSNDRFEHCCSPVDWGAE